nr:unnamed protein product [Callosobruchus analis]
MLSVILVNFTLRVIRTRYQIISKILVDFTEAPDGSEKASSSIIRAMKILCKRCYFMVDAFNTLFGSIIFLTVVNTSSALLNCLMWFFERSYESEDVGVEYRVTSLILYVAMYLTFTVLIVLSCDAIVKEGRRFTDSCFTLHVNHNNHYIKEEFKSLAVISEKIAPRFSAAGFYTINQMFLSTLFTALTSYAIVCIQFSSL